MAVQRAFPVLAGEVGGSEHALDVALEVFDHVVRLRRRAEVVPNPQLCASPAGSPFARGGEPAMAEQTVGELLAPVGPQDAPVQPAGTVQVAQDAAGVSGGSSARRPRDDPERMAPWGFVGRVRQPHIDAGNLLRPVTACGAALSLPCRRCAVWLPSCSVPAGLPLQTVCSAVPWRPPRPCRGRFVTGLPPRPGAGASPKRGWAEGSASPQPASNLPRAGCCHDGRRSPSGPGTMRGGDTGRHSGPWRRREAAIACKREDPSWTRR